MSTLRALEEEEEDTHKPAPPLHARGLQGSSGFDSIKAFALRPLPCILESRRILAAAGE